jgi:hypothetical protein
MTMAKQHKRICEYCGKGGKLNGYVVFTFRIDGRKVLAHPDCVPPTR